jgi:hypothetical protein
MTRNESDERRELRFVCPECGHDGLQTLNESSIEVDHVYDDGDFEWGSVRHEEIMDYHCGGCGYVLELEEDEELHHWLIAHCKQDDA